MLLAHIKKWSMEMVRKARYFSAAQPLAEIIEKSNSYSKMTKGIYRHLKLHADEYQKIQDTIMDLADQPEKLTRYMKITRVRMQDLENINSEYHSFEELITQLEEAKELLNQSKYDREMRNLAQEEYDKLTEQHKEVEKRLALEMLPIKKYDKKNCTVEIKQAVGGKESALFAEWLMEAYENFTDRKGWDWETDKLVLDDDGKGVKNSTFRVVGEGAYKYFKHESGVHKVQRVPETEKRGRIHSSTAVVIVMPEIPFEFTLDEKDIKKEIFRSSGPGGQHVNKTESAIRLTHIPTKITASIQDERCQHANLEKAHSVLRERVYMHEIRKEREKTSSERKSLMGNGELNERIRTYNWPQDRITDHRIGKSLFGLNTLQQGDHLETFLDEIIQKEESQILNTLFDKK